MSSPFNLYSFLMRYIVVIILGVFLSFNIRAKAQVSFEVISNPDVIFDFNTIDEYIRGITRMNAATLEITAGHRFDIYVGAETTNIGFWDVIQSYSNTGAAPTIDMVKIQFRNLNSTSQVAGFFDLQDISTPTYIIGSAVVGDPDVNCPLNGTNMPGDFNANPRCYKFKVDLRIVPGFSYKSGLYYLEIKYFIIEDL